MDGLVPDVALWHFQLVRTRAGIEHILALSRSVVCSVHRTVTRSGDVTPHSLRGVVPQHADAASEFHLFIKFLVSID